LVAVEFVSYPSIHVAPPSLPPGRSHDGNFLFVCSIDGYVSVIRLLPEALGTPLPVDHQ
jgi:hypothetical protein